MLQRCAFVNNTHDLLLFDPIATAPADNVTRPLSLDMTSLGRVIDLDKFTNNFCEGFRNCSSAWKRKAVVRAASLPVGDSCDSAA